MCFDLLRNWPLSSINIHFGAQLLVLVALSTSASLSKNKFFDRLENRGGKFRPDFYLMELSISKYFSTIISPVSRV